MVRVCGVEEGEFGVCALVLANFVLELRGVSRFCDEQGSSVDDGCLGI